MNLQLTHRSVKSKVVCVLILLLLLKLTHTLIIVHHRHTATRLLPLSLLCMHRHQSMTHTLLMAVMQTMLPCGSKAWHTSSKDRLNRLE
jgi:hypothetical protein